MTNKRWTTACLTGATMLMLITGCGKSEKTPAKGGADAAAAEGIKIGVLYSTTGPFSRGHSSISYGINAII